MGFRIVGICNGCSEESNRGSGNVCIKCGQEISYEVLSFS